MGFLKNIFGKKSSETEQDIQVKPSMPPALPTLMYNEPEALRKYVDTKKPVLIIGGKYNNKQVILTSNPNEKKFTNNHGKEWPGVTVEMVMSGEQQPQRFFTTKEPTPKPQPKKTEPVKKEEKPDDGKLNVYRILPNGDEELIDRISIDDTPVKKPVFDVSEAFNTNKIKYELPYFLLTDVKIDKSLEEHLEEFIADSPDFDLDGLSDVTIPEETEEWYNKTLSFSANHILEGDDACKAGKWKVAARHYCILITNRSWDPYPYDMMMRLYEDSGQKDFQKQLREYAIQFFTDRREKMERHLLELGEQQNCKELAERYIKEKRKVTYYQGLFDVYDPFPCIEIWKSGKLISDDSHDQKKS